MLNGASYNRAPINEREPNRHALVSGDFVASAIPQLSLFKRTNTGLAATASSGLEVGTAVQRPISLVTNSQSSLAGNGVRYAHSGSAWTVDSSHSLTPFVQRAISLATFAEAGIIIDTSVRRFGSVDWVSQSQAEIFITRLLVLAMSTEASATTELAFRRDVFLNAGLSASALLDATGIRYAVFDSEMLAEAQINATAYRQRLASSEWDSLGYTDLEGLALTLIPAPDGRVYPSMSGQIRQFELTPQADEFILPEVSDFQSKEVYRNFRLPD